MTITFMINELLFRTQKIKEETIKDIHEDLIEPFISSKSALRLSLLENRITKKVLYLKTDSYKKYGNSLELLLLDNEPIFFYTRGCKWLDTYVIYHINDKHTQIFKDFLNNCLKEEERPLYMTDQKLVSLEWFGNYGLFKEELPIIEKEDQ